MRAGRLYPEYMIAARLLLAFRTSACLPRCLARHTTAAMPPKVCCHSLFVHCAQVYRTCIILEVVHSTDSPDHVKDEIANIPHVT